MKLETLRMELQQLANPEQAQILQRFFKTRPGEYAYGDLFLGIKVPVQRKIAKRYTHLPLASLKKLLASKFHEERLVALVILIDHYQRTPAENRQQIVDFYLQNSARINNWDLVDISAPKILGHFCLTNLRQRRQLVELAKSANLWERRIAVLSTFPLIKNGDFRDSIRIYRMLLQDPHDLIHKAIGWMLREMGKISLPDLENFLQLHRHRMPRTALRYAIEKFSPNLRRQYLAPQNP